MTPDSSRIESTIMSVIMGVVANDETFRRRQLERFHEQYCVPLRNHAIASRQVPPNRVDDLLQDFILKRFLRTDATKNLAWRYLERRRDDTQLRFRAYLLRAWNNYIIDQHRTDQRGVNAASLQDMGFNEALSAPDPGQDRFDIDWSANLLSQTLAAMRAECKGAGQEVIWEVFHARILDPLVSSTEPPDYTVLVERFAFDSPKQASNRLQTAIRKFNRLLRANVADYLPSTTDASVKEEIEEEIRDLRRALSAPNAIRLAALGISASEVECDETTVSSVSPSLFAMDDRAEAIWNGPEDLKGMWRHLLSLTIKQYFEQSKMVLPDSLKGAMSNDSHVSLAQLIADATPAVELLEAIKTEAKLSATRQRKSALSAHEDAQVSNGGLPESINATLYLAMIASARVRLNRRISRSSDAELCKRMQYVLTMKWIDENTRSLLQEATDGLQ